MVIAVPAHADAGTALAWLSIGHLLFGNLLIGLAEWSLLIWLAGEYRRPSNWSAFAMIAGNYASAWAGVLICIWVFPSILGWHGGSTPLTRLITQPLYQAKEIIATAWVAFFLLTLIVEWGFVHWAMAAGETRWPRALLSLRNTVIVNLASYSVLTLMYYGVSPISLITKMRPDPALSFCRNVGATVYYLGIDGDVHSVRADGTQRRRVAVRPRGVKVYRLRLVLNQESGSLDLITNDVSDYPDGLLWAESVGRAPAFSDTTRSGSGRDPRPKYTGDDEGEDGPVLDLRPVGQTQEMVGIGQWAWGGILVEEAYAGRAKTALRLQLETPFLSAAPSCGTVLDHDLLICQCRAFPGPYPSQIVVFDLRQRKFGVLVDGSSPQVVLDAPPAGATWWQPGMPPLAPERNKSRGQKP